MFSETWTSFTLCVTVFLLLACAPWIARAEVIVSQGGAGIGESTLGGPVTFTAFQSWASTVAFTGVSVSVNVGTTDPSFGTFTAWLMTQVGPGTTVGDQVATNTFTAPTVSDFFTAPPLTTLFTGLSLVPGTYFLVLSAPTGSSGPGWEQTADFVPTTAPGVIASGQAEMSFQGVPGFDPAFPPDSPFLPAEGLPLGYEVDGTQITVPEPSTLALLGIGLLTFIGARQRRDHAA
jgi:hypothetical protein